jgi:pimeloyl-ACP methyl ester carboxylesterase
MGNRFMRTLGRMLCSLSLVALSACGGDAKDGREGAGGDKDATGPDNDAGAMGGDAGDGSAEPDEQELSLELPLRSTGSVKIHAWSWSGGASSGATVLAVHGLSESAAVYRPLALAMLEDASWKKRVQRVIAIDMPGHGKSDFPDPDGVASFGELAIEDYVGIVIDAIGKLDERGLGPSVVIGHSMGGLELQAAQERLLASGSSLARLGVTRAVMLAPVPAHARPWMVPASGDLSPFVVQDMKHGAYLELPVEVFLAQSFGRRADGMIVANAPTPAQATEAGYAAREPMSVLTQLLEAPVPLPDGTMLMPKRPSVRAGAFAPGNGTTLELVSFSQDPLVQAADLKPLYDYLNGGSDALYHAIEANDAAHNMFVSNPGAVLDALQWPDLASDAK